MKKTLFFLVAIVAGGAMAVWVVNFVGWEEIKTVFFIFSWRQGLIIIFLTGLMLFTGLWKWQVVLRGHDYNISIFKLGSAYLVSFSISFLFPMMFFGGELFRGFFLKEKFAIPWSKAMSSIVIDRVLETTAFLMAIISGIAYFIFSIGLLPKNLGIIFTSTLLLFSAATGFFYFKVLKKESIAKAFLNFFNHKKPLNGQPLDIEKEIFFFFKHRKKQFFIGIFLSSLRVFITWLRTWLLVMFLGKNIGFFPVLSVLAFDYFSSLVPIPTALGIHEMAQLFAFSALGAGAVLAPAFTMIQRGA